MKKALTFSLYEYTDAAGAPPVSVKPQTATTRGERENGRDWPSIGETMIGHRRMENIQACLTEVLDRGIAGDVIETGVWRGGASIFMRAILTAYGSDKTVYLADSFKGLPPPDLANYPEDRGLNLHAHSDTLACSLKQVKSNFARYGLLDQKVEFLEGWFKDTLPRLSQNHQWSLIRLDGDYYESTIQALDCLYHNLQPCGFLIVDDYGALRQTRQAVDDFRAKHGITEPIKMIDWAGAYFQKAA